MRAVISKNPLAKYYGLPEEIETVEITHVLKWIQHLSEVAKFVNEHPEQHCPAALDMAYVIKQIEMAVLPPK